MEEKKNNGKGFGIAALVLGIVACILAWFYVINVVALVCAIVGLVLACKARKLGKSGIITAGLVLSIIGLCLSAIGVLSCTICVACVANDVSNSIQSTDWNDVFNQLQ